MKTSKFFNISRVFLGLASLSVSLVAMANTNDRLNDRLLELYKSTDKSFDLECFYYSPIKDLMITPINQTTMVGKTVVRDFSVRNIDERVDMRVKILQADESEINNPRSSVIGSYEVELNNRVYRGNITDNYFKAFYVESSFDELDNEYEIRSLYCRLGLARTQPYELKDTFDNLHVNVHPHTNYDFKRETVDKVQAILDSKERKNVILIEEQDDVKGQHVNLHNFLETGIIPELPISIYKTPLTLSDEDDLVISPAGHNRYEFSKKDGTLDIMYTGGFHNYCVWNNTRNLIRSFFRSESTATLNINYKLDSLIVQRLGVISSLNFGYFMIRKTRLMSNLLANKPKFMKKYFRNYFKFFSGPFINKSTFGTFTSTFKTLTIKYDSPLFKEEKVIQGNGSRDLKINLNYL